MSYACLCYVSEATKADHLIRQDLMDIINEAVIFNGKHQIFGVLYYGHGYFLQYLEGEQEKIEHLYYEKILKDSRHTKAQIIYSNPIETLRFSSWNMKFAPYNKSLVKMVTGQEDGCFNPYLLEENKIPKIIDFLYRV